MLQWWRNRRKAINRFPTPNGRHLLNPEWSESEESPSATASTFVEATSGGWSDPPDIIAEDDSNQTDYVGQQLAKAAKQAESMAIGERFTYILTDIPRGISDPNEIMLGLMIHAQDYGLAWLITMNEKVEFEKIG